MQISLTGHHIDITDSLRNCVESKFERLERHFDHVSNVHVILTVEKLRQKAEAKKQKLRFTLTEPMSLLSQYRKICMPPLMLWLINWIGR